MLREWILRLRWVLMSLLGGLVVFYELTMHGPNAFQKLEFEFLFESLLMGIILPLMGGYLLTKLARSKARSARHKQRLDQYKFLFQGLAQHREWGELMKFVAQYPGTILPVEHTSLYIYDHHLARLEFAAEWNRVKANSAVGRDPAFGICQTCLSSQAMLMRPADQCPFIPCFYKDRPPREFCLALSYDKMLIGILRLSCQPGQTLTPEQIEFMNFIAPEVALSVALAIAHPRQLAQLRLQTQIVERQRTAIDLHNSLAQQIGYLHLGLDRLASDDQLQISDPVRRELERMREAANDSYEQVRGTLALLRSWESVDLTQAIADYFLKVARRAHLSNVFTTAGEPVHLGPELGRQIFSLFEEGLNNVENHAQARNVEVSLIWSAECLTMGIIDDGTGFDPLSAPINGHYGLMMMRELAYVLQGELEVDSSPGRGTRLNFIIPLAHLQAHAKSNRTMPILIDPPL